MKPGEAKRIINDIKARGYVEINNVFHPPDSKEAIKAKAKATKKTKSLKTNKIRSGWVDDHLNIKNKENKADVFIRLIKQELNIEVWPEFYFSTERLYRLDYAIPFNASGEVLKIGIEVQGGIWAKGNSGHSSGKGIKRDMDKSNLAQSMGWFIIKVTPDELITNKTLELIKTRLR